LRILEENQLLLEEIEAIRLRDIEHLEQEEGAKKMDISRPTFQRILAAARKKIADSIINGKALRIEGGNYKLADKRFMRIQENNEDNTKIAQENMEGKLMKIAIVTEDEKTICQHFGRAPWYEVFTLEDGKITGKEKRAKMGHHNFAGQDSQHGVQGERHGFDPASQGRHAGMAEAIKDCQVVIAGGMGMGAYESLKSYKIEPIITDIQDIEEAVNLYLQGKLPNIMERLH
jgi:predicted DNA-binding protein (UPF0251 family)/predicted Fe-Mo cluster-binding NifX family protein